MAVRELTQWDVERMQIPERYWSVTLDQVTATAEAHGAPPVPLRVVAEGYAAQIDKMVADGTGLLLHGNNGRGKTSLLVVLALEVRRHAYSVLYLETARLKRIVIDHERFDAGQDLWDRALTVDLLVLDDLGKGVGDSTGFMQELVDELLRTRGAHKRATMISTNVAPDALVSGAFVKKSTLAMLQETAAFFMVTGDDYRAPKADDLVKQILGAGAKHGA